MTLKELSGLYYLRKEIEILSHHDNKFSEVEQLRQKAADEERRLWQYISDIDDPYIRLIMELRFVKGLSWRQVSWKATNGAVSGKGCNKMISRYLKHMGK